MLNPCSHSLDSILGESQDNLVRRLQSSCWLEGYVLIVCEAHLGMPSSIAQQETSSSKQNAPPPLHLQHLLSSLKKRARRLKPLQNGRPQLQVRTSSG